MQLFKHNMKRILANKVRFTMLVIVPILFIFMFLLGSFNTVTIGIVDNDDSKLSKNIIEELTKNKFYNIKLIEKEQMITDVISYEVDYAIIIENGFEEKFIVENQLLIKDYFFVENENVMNVKVYLQSYMTNLQLITNQTNDKDSFYEILDDFEKGLLKVNNSSDLSGKINQSIFSIGFLVYFLIFISVITCGLILEDRKNGTLSRIFNSPISLKRYLFENLLSFICVGFLQVILVFLVFKFGFNFYYGDGLFNIMLLCFSFVIVSITMGLLIVSVVKSPIQAYLTVGVLASPLAMLGGCYWPLDMMPGWLQNVSKFIPTTWVMTGTNEILNDGNLFDILDNIGVLLLFACVFFIGGIFNKTDFAKTT